MFGLDEDSLIRLIYLSLLLALLAVFGWRGRRLSGALRHLVVWLLIFMAVLAAYAYRGPLLRFAEPILREINPNRVVEVVGETGERELVVGRAADGHFKLDAVVNGAEIRFLVDTGATSTVLSFQDAERAGIDLAALRFDRQVQTANGTAFSARTVVDAMSIGPFRLQNIPVAVMPARSLSTSLLGMSAINRFRGWRVEDDRLILSP